jgi:hypothetical protein
MEFQAEGGPRPFPTAAPLSVLNPPVGRAGRDAVTYFNRLAFFTSTPSGVVRRTK